MKYGAALIAIAICAGCSGARSTPSSTALPYQYAGKLLFVNGRPVTVARLDAMPRYTTLVPDRRSKPKIFEYIINEYNSYAGIFDYPKSVAQIGTIPNVGGQGCANVLYGYGKSFWIVAGYNQITEYRAPKKPIKTLFDSVGAPSSCAMDPSGDLAVGILAGSGAGDVVIYKNASGSGTVFTTPLANEYFDGYDSQGNLFADGLNNGKFMLVELPKGSSKFQTITVNNTVQAPGSVQWDGKYLAVTDQLANAIYRYTISGTKATLQGTVQFTTSAICSQTWIVKGLVFCANAGNNDGLVFKYPAGGSAIATLTGNFDLPLGTVAARK